jgi:hypothetical protein
MISHVTTENRQNTHFWTIVPSRMNLLTRITAFFSKSSYIYEEDWSKVCSPKKNRGVYLALVVRKFQRLQLDQFRWEGKQWLALKL